MAENVMEQIVAELRTSATKFYPQYTELRNVRIVGHTPKTDHFIYDIVMDFSDGSERVAAKVYRNKGGVEQARSKAKQESSNLNMVHKVAQKKKLTGVPRPLGDFTELGTVVAEKLSGLPLQSIIMKAALLPGFSNGDGLAEVARHTGAWLRSFHRATVDMSSPFEPDRLLAELEQVCAQCRKEGLEEGDVRSIMTGARHALHRGKKTLAASAVLNDFTPLNVIVTEGGVGISEFSRMNQRGTSFQDVAMFMASIEALEKYPFCNRSITSAIQKNFLEAYGVSASDQAVLRVLKMKALLSMFAQGRGIKESAVRKKVMWATVMKRFIQQAAQRSLAQPEAAHVA
ncbi:MAG TPA: hypothetical protein VK699_17620 [Terriglobales bacterium]|jgi:hypothetical protein|nr:hypothetical protein [Terriglobales bacterium]